MFETMGFDAWWAALRPKYGVTLNMHRMLPKDLDFFICMSSAAGQIGSIAQSNYNAGKSIVLRITSCTILIMQKATLTKMLSFTIVEPKD